ncbi:phage tail assembly protein [Cronobacter muytjensii]|uniref:phage tail assembly protein n=1 Tax=Cronobacter muytjensii TaxID=413501 RepID=UPI002DB56C87|nr:phage tail assembly protein [Cronobacter muytjensii]MEB8638664.1 phage tail assembly protein [Cronobacter muytjensii]
MSDLNYPLDRVVIKLSRPVEIGGQTVEQLELFEPTLRDKILFSKDKDGTELEQEVRMMARLMNIADPLQLYNLPSCDYTKLQKAFDELVKDPADRKMKF